MQVRLERFYLVVASSTGLRFIIFRINRSGPVWDCTMGGAVDASERREKLFPIHCQPFVIKFSSLPSCKAFEFLLTLQWCWTFLTTS